MLRRCPRIQGVGVAVDRRTDGVGLAESIAPVRIVRSKSWRVQRAVLLMLAMLSMTLLACDIEATPATTPPAATAGAGDTATARSTTQPAGTGGTLTSARVVRVVDGDTLVVELDDREERLRYIGIATPETVKQGSPVECFGKEASRENARLVEGMTVELE